MSTKSIFAALILIGFVSAGLASNYTSEYAELRGICEETSNPGASTDAWGDVMGTIPWGSPGPNSAWTASTWANGQLIVIKNILPNTAPSMFFKVNPQTGVITDSVYFPFNGFVSGATFDGTNLWVVEYSPAWMIHEVSLTGTLIASYTWALYPYLARCIMWDGQYLWVGANYVAGNTKLYRMTTSGTVQLAFVSSSAVGWYMDGEFDPAAPPGSNFCVVDNIGHTIKRLTVSGSFVTVAEQIASPAALPDIAEGLAFDGDNLWHNSSDAIQGLIWKLDDGFPAMSAPMSVTITPTTPPVEIPANGGNFQYDINVHNLTAQPQTFQVWNKILTPQGQFLPAFGPVTRTLPGNVSATRTLTQAVAASVPAGVNTYISYIGTYPGVIQDSSFFTFLKLAVSDGGSWVSETQGFGNFFDEYAGEVMPEACALNAAFPNPFNPTTAISYELRAASFVSIRVYDTAGRLATTLVDGWREAGNNQLIFDASGLPSGIYLCRLQAGEVSATQKLVLMK